MPRTAPVARTLAALAAALAPSTAIAAQASFAHNGIEFSNWWLTDREDLFPNYLTAGGNVDGDGLFKVLPGEILERAEPHRLSGYQVTISIDDAYAGTFPVQVALPGVQLYATRLQTAAGREYEVPDVTAAIGPRFDPIPLSIPSDNSWVVEVEFDPRNQNQHTRQLLAIPPRTGAGRGGLAMLVLAPPGETRASGGPGVVLQSSFGERHLDPGRDSHSGSFDQGSGAVRPFGTAGMPSASGELYAALRFDNPTLQLSGASAGGVDPDPQGFETRLGPGAYATDLASRSRPAGFALHVQAQQFHPQAAPTHLAFPFVVALGAGGPIADLSLGVTALRVDPLALAAATALVDAGAFGPLQLLQAASGAGFDVDQRGVYRSPTIPVPNQASLRGATLWLQALLTTVSLEPAAATNAVRLVL